MNVGLRLHFLLHNCYKIINTATGKDDKLHDIFELHYYRTKKI